MISGRRRGRCRGRPDPARGRASRDLAVARPRRASCTPAATTSPPVKRALAAETADVSAARGDARRRDGRRRRLHRRLRRHRARGDRRDDGRPTRSSSGWPTRTPRCTPTSPTGTPAVVATGRSRLPQPDQQRAGLPGHLPRAPSTSRATAITEGMKLAAADALAGLVGDDLDRGPDRARRRSTRAWSPRLAVAGRGRRGGPRATAVAPDRPLSAARPAGRPARVAACSPSTPSASPPTTR